MNSKRTLLIVVAILSFALTLRTSPVNAQAGKVAGTKPAEKKRDKSKSQEVLASKSAHFGTVSDRDTKVTAATDAKDLAGARKYIGKEGSFVGTVVAVFAPASNSIVILNFAAKYKEAVSAIVKPAAFSKFPNLQTLKGEKLLISGKVIDYHGQPEIELLTPSQVHIVK